MTEPLSETAKAAQEVAKAAGQSIEAARELGGFVARFVAGPLEQAAGLVEDKLKYLRWERQQRLILRADQYLRERGLSDPTRAVPLKLAIPLLQAASIEDDDDLQDMWARLLVNAADADSGIDVTRTYIDILEKIGPLEAKILQTIYSLDFAQIRQRGVSTCDLPGSSGQTLDVGLDDLVEPRTDVALALANLTRLGCLKHTSTWGGGETFRSILPTLLGKTFIEACTASKAA